MSKTLARVIERIITPERRKRYPAMQKSRRQKKLWWKEYKKMSKSQPPTTADGGDGK